MLLLPRGNQGHGATVTMLIKPVKVDAFTPFWYDIELDHRGTEVPVSPGSDAHRKSDLVLQKSQASTNSVLRTIVNVFETKQSPYRILLAFRDGGNTRYYQVAEAGNLDELQRNRKFLLESIMNGLRNLDEADRETWALDKLNAFLSGSQASARDEGMVAASRAFHSYFQVPDSEKLVYFCSAGVSAFLC